MLTQSTAGVAPKHLVQRLLFEELNRRRRPSDHERYVETFRRSAVDPNPHQVEAVGFALSRLEHGGALLCDEVGLGKTIETGLLLTQLRAEGRGHILIIVPVPLLRQWQVELRDLFSLKSRALGPDQDLTRLRRPGIYLAGREFAGSAKWAPQLAAAGPWDLVVVDEAHELLSSIYKRFSGRDGRYTEDLRKGHAKRAGHLKSLMGESPVLVLTATPLQNNLLEMWGLVHFVDPRQTVLGDRQQFTSLFCANDGKALKDGMERELQTRLEAVVCRTLRVQAQPFLKLPFTARHCETINFHMQATERELYERVTAWLTGPVAAYRARHQRLMTLMLRRRMGSSVHALASSLEAIRTRLEGPDDNWDQDADLDLVEADIRELIELERLATRALAGPSPKLERLLEIVEKVHQGALRGVASDKLVIFTESRRTLESIVKFLHSRGLEGQVTAFSGTNEGPAAEAALKVWEAEVGVHLDASQKPEKSSAMRAALVHEFRHRTRILVATEAGAKGLNLQFCNCLVNFDLPWNPQRVEQRIGRVHRYGQKHDVVIVNFINLDNEGEQRVYELLKDKLQLFEGLFGTSDAVLGNVASLLDFEGRIEKLMFSCRTAEERQQEFDRLELELTERSRKFRESRLNQARNLIAGLDHDVQARLKLTSQELPLALSRRDEAVLRLLRSESEVTELRSEGDRTIFRWKDRLFHLGPPDPSERCGEPLDLGHPLVQGLRQDWGPTAFVARGPAQAWHVYRVTVVGIEEEDVVLVLGPGGEAGLLEQLAANPDLTETVWESPDDLDDALDDLRARAEAEQRPRVERLMNQLTARKRDVERCLDLKEQGLRLKLADADRKRRGARGADAMRLANAHWQRVHNELERLRADRDQQILEANQALARQQNELHQRRFVRATAHPLFSLELRP